MNQQREGSLLGHYRVLDLSNEMGVLCGKTLADLGADVIKVEPPGGDPMRQIGPFYHDTPDPEKSLYWFTFNTSKRSMTLDITSSEGQEIFKKLAETADFVIECFPPGYLDKLGLGYSVLSQLNPRLIMTSITPFGQSGPYRDYKACDIVGIAMGGLLYLNGEPDRPPVRVRAQQGFAQASVQAAAGTMVAHYYREISGQGQHVDLSMQEAVSNTLDTAQQAWDLQQMIYTRVAPSRPLGEQLVRCVYPCKDGYVACWAPETLQGIADWMQSLGIPFDADEVARWIELRQKMAAGEIPPGEAFTQEDLTRMQELRLPLLERLTRQEIYDEALARGFGWAPVNTPKDLVENQQLAVRNYFVEVEHPELGTSITYPGAPLKLSETPWRIWNRAPLIGEHNEEIYAAELGIPGEEINALKQAKITKGGQTGENIALDGVKVVDFSWYAVGPQTARHLADHGAEVIRVESSTRIDGLRRVGPFRDGIPGLNSSGYFNNQNPNKYGITLNLKLPKGAEIAKRLIARADVVIESFTPGVIESFGLGYDDLRKVKPDIIMVSASAQGRGGPYSGHSAFGHVQQALSGVNHLTGWPDGYPTGAHGPYTDFFVPHLTATVVLAALAYRKRTGKGQYIELSQLEASIHCLETAILDYTVNGREQSRMGNHHPQAAPHGVYRCQGDDRWCAIAVFTDEEWQNFCGVLDNTEWTEDSALATVSGRLERADELDRLIGEWTSNYSPEQVMTLMQAAGVAAGVVQNSKDLHEDPQLKYRNHYWVLDHPETGPATYDSPSYKLSRTPAQPRMPAPCLGEHNELVCSQMLGMSDEEFVELVTEGVFE